MYSLHKHNMCTLYLTHKPEVAFSEQKLVREWAWLDSRITANILSMPGPVAVCILEPEKPTGLEIQYV